MSTHFIVEDIPDNCLTNITFRNFLNKSRGFKKLDFNNLNKYYLYTGRGPSTSSFHLGHLIGLKITLSLYKQYFNNKKIFFMLSDDEKIFRDNIKQLEMNKNVKNTVSILNQIGFNNTNTNIKINSTGLNETEYNILIKLMNSITFNQLQNIYGEKNNIGDYFYYFVQMIPCFIYPSKTCVVIAGKDQDTYFRIARDLSRKCKFNPPIILYHDTVMGLDGTNKMSSSLPSTIPIYINDTVKQITKKINSIKFVGAGTLEELLKNGANLYKDVPYKMIKLFDTTENINIIKNGYTKGDTFENLTKLFNENELISCNKNKLFKILTKGVRRYLKDLIVKILVF